LRQGVGDSERLEAHLNCATIPKLMSGRISVFLADDNLIVREGVRALLELESDISVVAAAADYDELVEGAVAAEPHVVVTA